MAYRIAFLTDIHGNLHALEAVLREVRRAAPDLVLVGGDLTYQFPYPRESLELLDTVAHRAVAGNTERYVTDWATAATWPDWLPVWGGPHARWTREQIGEEWATRLAALPEELTLSVAGAERGAGELLLTHGVPGNQFVGIHHAPGPGNRHPDWAMPEAALDRHLRGTSAGLILAGHTHIPMVRRWRDAVIVNPGAVAYTWRPTPDTHQTRWALLTYRPGQGWEIDLRTVPYDNEAALRGLLEIASHAPIAAKIGDMLASPMADRR